MAEVCEVSEEEGKQKNRTRKRFCGLKFYFNKTLDSAFV